jgi:hypothetical protein
MNGTIEKLHLVASESVGAEWSIWPEKFNGNIYHSVSWADTRVSSHSRPLFFHWLDDEDRCVGIAVGIKSSSPIRCIGRFFKRLDFESYPAVEGNGIDSAKLMIKQLLNFAKEGGYCSLTIQSYFSNVVVPDMDRLGFITTPRIEFILDLTKPEEELWKQLAEHHRRKIKKANKHGLLFEEVCTLDAMKQLRKLQISSRDRRMRRGEHLGMLDEAFYVEMGKGYFEKNLGRIFLITHENQAISSAFVSMYAGKALYVLGGSSDEGFKLDAPALLFWKIFSRCRELGCREFSMGGVPTSAVNPESQSFGLYRFKAGFGGRQVMCLSVSAENLQPLRGWLVRIAKKGWRSWKSL